MRASLALIALAALIAGCGERKLYEVPAENCQERRTGSTREETHFQCVTVGNNPCGTQMPITTTYYEVEISCRPYTVWR